MVDPTLPPGTTHADIDKHFGPPDKVRLHGDVVLGVSVEANEHWSDREKETELMDRIEKLVEDVDDIHVLHAEVHEEEPIP